MPKEDVKSRSKTHQIKSDNKALRHQFFLKHLGIKESEGRRRVTFPVHFPLSMYDYMCLCY